MKIQANQLSSHLLKSLAPCYLVTGDEFLLVDEALDAIREQARERGFLSRESHVATTGFDWNALTASTSNFSLFAEQRIIEDSLRRNSQHRQATASELGISRVTLYNKMKKFGLLG